MAINNVNMIAEIDREIKRIQARDTNQRDTLDVVTEAWDMGQEQRKWNERKNLQRQQIMADLTKDTSRLYSNKDAKFQRDRFKKYFDRHKGNMDESTLEMGQMMIGNYDYQIAQNDDFSKYKDGMDSQMEKVDNFLKKPEFEIGKEYTDKEVEEFREVYQGYVDFTEKFTSDHADRLQLAGNSHVLQELSQGSYANKFMLDSFYGDKKIDETEYKAYSQALASNSLEPITKYKDYEKTIIKSSNESLLKSMDDNAELLRNYNLVAEGALDISAVLGKDYGGSYEMATDEERGMIDDAILSLGDELEEDNKRHIERHGKDYLYDPKIGILSKVKKLDTNINTNTETNIETETETETKTPKTDLTELPANVKMKFNQAKKRKPDMTIDEFIKNRPNIKAQITAEADEAKYVENAKKNVSDINTDLDRLMEANKDVKSVSKGRSHNTFYGTKDGKKVRYNVSVVSPKGKVISGKDIEHLAEGRKGKTVTQEHYRKRQMDKAKIKVDVYIQNAYTGKYEKQEKSIGIDALLRTLG